MRNKKLLDSIAKHLPDGLTDEAISKVAELISESIESRVKQETEALTRKTYAFIRGNLETLKEQAIKELELENDTFRNAQLFETVKSVFAVENTAQDEVNGLAALAEMGEAQEEKNEALLKQVDKLLKENVSLKRQSKVLNDKNTKLEESLESVKGSLESLKESSTAERRLSDTALVINEQSSDVEEVGEKLNENSAVKNEWINTDALAQLKNLK